MLGHDHDYKSTGEDLIERLVAAVEREPRSYMGVATLVAAAGVDARTLDELCLEHYHATPTHLLTRARVAAAQKALLGSSRPVDEIAMDVGFENVSAFDLDFGRFAGMSPSTYRQLGQFSKFELALPGDYPTRRILRYLGRDPHSLTERVDGQRYLAAFPLNATHGHGDVVVVTVEFSPEVARCEIVAGSSVDPEAPGYVHRRLMALLGLSGDPSPFERQVAGAPDLAPLLDGQRGLRVPLIADAFDALVWAIVGQQINLSFAFTLRRRLVALIGAEVGHGLFGPPTAMAVAALEPTDLTAIGFSRAKAGYLIDAARLVVAGKLPLDEMRGMSATRIERTLLAVRGIGPWSAHYLLMRSYGFPDCVPLGDAVLAASLQRYFGLEARPGKRETLALMNRFRPHRSLATFHFWQRHGTVA